jgi:hypothetical protein
MLAYELNRLRSKYLQSIKNKNGWEKFPAKFLIQDFRLEKHYKLMATFNRRINNEPLFKEGVYERYKLERDKIWSEYYESQIYSKKSKKEKFTEKCFAIAYKKVGLNNKKLFKQIYNETILEEGKKPNIAKSVKKMIERVFVNEC